MSQKFSAQTATAVIVASMIGTGVFTSLGFQLASIQSPFVLMMLWVVGGLVACCGAMSYAELAAALPRSGGEYNFLREIYHPAAGFISGWISATIGFAAPTALVAITFGTYLASALPGLSPTWLACTLVVVLTGVHARTRRGSAGTQRALTAIKVLLILAYCAAAWALVESPQDISFAPRAGDAALLASSAFAVSLIYVNYAYTGWNAATYITGELAHPQRIVSRVLLVGAAIVMVLYLLLNLTFLHVAPAEAMVGKLEVGYVVAQYAFGAQGAKIMGVVLALLLVSTASAMIIAGPRVLQVIGQDFDAFKLLATVNQDGVPAVAIVTQSALALTFILTASFESILVFAGFTLGVSAFVTVLGLFVLRFSRPLLTRPYRVSWFPVPPLVFLSVTGWTLIYIVRHRPMEGAWGLFIIAAGALIYALTKPMGESRQIDDNGPPDPQRPPERSRVE